MNKLNSYVGILAAATLAVMVWFVFFKKDATTGESTVTEFLGGSKKK